MKTITCDCGYIAKGQMDEAVLDDALRHVRDAHPEKLEETPEADIRFFLKRQIKEESAIE